MQVGDAERMFVAFRLGVPCRTQPMRRDLTADASDWLAVKREAFLAEFRRENGWLEDLGNTVFLDAYVKDLTASLALQHLVPNDGGPGQHRKRDVPDVAIHICCGR